MKVTPDDYGSAASIFPLNTFDMCMTTKSFSGLVKHIYAVIKASNMCIFQGTPFVFRKYSSSNRNIKKIS